MIQQDLEALLGLVSTNDDQTSLVYKLLKDTKNKIDLLKYRKLCSDPDLERRLESIAKGHKKNDNAGKEDNRRPSFKDWLSRQGSS